MVEETTRDRKQYTTAPWPVCVCVCLIKDRLCYVELKGYSRTGDNVLELLVFSILPQTVHKKASLTFIVLFSWLTELQRSLFLLPQPHFLTVFSNPSKALHKSHPQSIGRPWLRNFWGCSHWVKPLGESACLGPQGDLDMLMWDEWVAAVGWQQGCQQDCGAVTMGDRCQLGR